MSAFALGIISGLLAAFMQSCSYLGGRMFLARYGNSSQLMMGSLLVSGIAAIMAAPFLLQDIDFSSWQIWLYIIMSDIGMLAGHWGFFSAQKHIESSRIASLLGLKMLVVVMLTIVLLHESFTIVQYSALLLAVASGMLINWSRGKLEWRGMGYLMLSFFGYALSDLGIQLLVKELNIANPILGGINGFIINYSLTGVLALLMFKPSKMTCKMLIGVLPQGLCWVASMIGLYICFGLLGAAFGNVLQASRGIISLLIGVILSTFAIKNCDEQKQSTIVWLRKGIAALLMFAAIVTYALSKR